MLDGKRMSRNISHDELVSGERERPGSPYAWIFAEKGRNDIQDVEVCQPPKVARYFSKSAPAAAHTRSLLQQKA